MAHGEIGAVFALEVSRLARSSADWYRLLELCRLSDVLIIDEQAIHTPRDYNDRLLLGLKGTMSEAEQYWMRLGLEGGRLSKARRGELPLLPPAGYIWDAELPGFRIDPDQEVQRAIGLVFKRFRLDGSAYAVSRYFARQGMKMPARDLMSRELRWGPPRYTLVINVLHNPIYAGAYVYGRSETRMALIDGKVRRNQKRKLGQEKWKVCLKNQHLAYITWEEFMSNQQKLDENRSNRKSAPRPGVAREGQALLQGLALCGRCGKRMAVHYKKRDKVMYRCMSRDTKIATCFEVCGTAIDKAVSKLFLEAVKPPEIELGMAVALEVERQAEEVAHQWRLRMDRARFEAQLTERRYKAVDPDNRVVAQTLENDWEEKLRDLEELREEYARVCRQEKVVLTDADREKILSLAKDLPKVWHAKSTTARDRKNLLGMLIEHVTLTPVEIPKRATRIQILWQTQTVSEITIDRPSYLSAQATSKEALALIQQLFEKQVSDEEIASELNRCDIRTGRDYRWDAASVQRIRVTYGWRRTSPYARNIPDQRADGLYSTHGIAAELGVTPSVIQGWIRKGLLPPVEQGGPGRPHWFKLDASTKERLMDAKRKGYCRADQRSDTPTKDIGKGAV